MLRFCGRGVIMEPAGEGLRRVYYRMGVVYDRLDGSAIGVTCPTLPRQLV